jgi:hypothetical protein
MKVEKLLEDMVVLQHKKAVLEALAYFLEVYLPNDDGSPAKTLLVQDPCLIPQVPIKVVETVCDELYEQIRELETQLSNLKEMEVNDH